MTLFNLKQEIPLRKRFNIALISLLIIVGTGCEKKNDPDLIIGKWEWSIVQTDTGVKCKYNIVTEFTKDGKETSTASGFLQVDEKKASFDCIDISKWRIDDEYLIELTVSTKYFNYEGDPQLIKLLKKRDSKNNTKENKSKIIELTEKTLIIEFDIEDEEVKKVIARRITI